MSLIKKWFGPFKEDVWKQIAAEYSGEYVDGGFWNPDLVRAFVDPWEIVLDTYKVKSGKSSKTYTRIRAPFENRDEFYFKIYYQHFYHDLARYFGFKEIEIKDHEFDSKFIIKGNDEFKIQWMFDDRVMKDHLYSLTKVHFEIRNDDGIFKRSSLREGMDELYFEVRGTIRSIDELRKIFELFSHTLGKLTELDSAYT